MHQKKSDTIVYHWKVNLGTYSQGRQTWPDLPHHRYPDLLVKTDLLALCRWAMTWGTDSIEDDIPTFTFYPSGARQCTLAPGAGTGCRSTTCSSPAVEVSHASWSTNKTQKVTLGKQINGVTAMQCDPYHRRVDGADGKCEDDPSGHGQQEKHLACLEPRRKNYYHFLFYQINTNQ